MSPETVPTPKDRIEAELWACQVGMSQHEHDSPEWTRLHDIQQAIMWVIDPRMCASPVTAAFRRTDDWVHPYANFVSGEPLACFPSPLPSSAATDGGAPSEGMG